MEQGKRVLVVDDDGDFVKAISVLLESSGLSVRTAADGHEALRVAQAWQPHLVLLDIMLRERTEGFFVLQELRRTPGIQDTPVIVISSLYTEVPGFRVSPDGGWLPVEEFLPKPVDSSRLLEIVRKALARPATAAQPTEGNIR